MKTHPSTGRNHRTSKSNRSPEAATAKTHGATYGYRSEQRGLLNARKRLSPPQSPLPGLTPAEQQSFLRQQALTNAHQGNYEEAIALFSLLIESNPTNASDYSNRGLVHFQNGEADAALADYNRAIELNPRLDSVYNNRANYYAAQGQFLEAMLDYDIALDLNPTNVRTWINQGITFRELEMYDRAIESFDLALCLGKLEGHIYAERGRTYHLRGDWNCAIGDYRRAIEKLPVSQNSPIDASARLRLQVQRWLDELLSPLQM